MLKRLLAAGAAIAVAFSLTACVDQHPEEEASGSEGGASEETRIVATSYATIEIFDRLGLDLVGVPKTVAELPEKYRDLPQVGTPMAPDAEQIVMLEPTDVVGPDTLIDNIKPSYDAANLPYTFINLQSVPGMYDSIDLIAEKYGVQDKAAELRKEYDDIMADFNKSVEGKEHPRVLVLMGLPGSYIECTPNSYVGSLVELAGAESVVDDEMMNFLSLNTEELLKLDPDVILLTAHGLPDMAMEMFSEEFKTNDIWRHFRAVQENRVYQLDYEVFNMSCTFDWPEALEDLKEILYEGTYESYDTGIEEE